MNNKYAKLPLFVVAWLGVTAVDWIGYVTFCCIAELVAYAAALAWHCFLGTTPVVYVVTAWKKNFLWSKWIWKIINN